MIDTREIAVLGIGYDTYSVATLGLNRLIIEVEVRTGHTTGAPPRSRKLEQKNAYQVIFKVHYRDDYWEKTYMISRSLPIRLFMKFLSVVIKPIKAIARKIE